MTVRELWLVRHGESVGNIAASAAEASGLEVIDLAIRDADVPLSPVGNEQADAVGRWLRERAASIDTFWCSPYLRARQTLEIASSGLEVPRPVIVDERFRDRELGVLDLLTTRGVRSRHPEEVARRLHLGKFYHRPPGGESWADLALRLRGVLRDLDATDARSVLVVAHDAVVMLVLYVLLEMSEADLLEFAAGNTVANASVTHVVRATADDGWVLERFSDVQHLAAEGAPVTIHPGDDDVRPS